MKLGDIKGERSIKTEKHSSDASAGKGSKIKGSVTQKMNASESAKTTEKQHYTIKLTNANKKTAEDGVEPIVIEENTTTTQKKHVSNIKWTAGKVAQDSVAPKTKSTDIHLKMPTKKKE